MEVFNDDVRFVRLRCCARRGYYLAADVDGRHVCLSRQRGVHNSVWAVQHATDPDGDPCVLLRGAYGRYLLATNVRADTGPSHGVAAVQADLEEDPPPPGMTWAAVPERSSFVLRSFTGRFLRGNGRYLRWRRTVTAARDNGSTMMQWSIHNVPVRITRPCVLDPTYQLTRRRRRPLTASEVSRQIRYARGDENGEVEEEEWRTMQLRTNNLMQLRLTLACRMGASRDVARTTLCVRAGSHGQLSPLLVDLPIGNNPVDVVILTHGTQADNDLCYPDLNAP
ncbi:hypothetical protein ACP70R_030275 [Stipagrostis hirtigluma subsp. patula]